MSWSVSSPKDKPVVVKQALAAQFECAKSNTVSVLAENKSVRLAEEIVNTALDQMIASEYPLVEVSGNGSASNDGPVNEETGKKLWDANMSFNLRIQPYTA